MAVEVEGIVVSDEVWTKWVAVFSVVSSRNIVEVINEEWPLLIRKIMDFTPPFKVRSLFASANAAHASDYSIGRKAVAFDIYKTMRPFDPKAIRTPRMQKIVEQKDAAAFNIIAARSQNPLMRGLYAIPFDPSEHMRQRNARGRVPGHDRRRVVLGSDVELLKAYVTKIQERVGYAKSGWLKALLLVGGDAPNYVTKQGTGGGDVVDLRNDEDNPAIIAINRTPWAIRKDEGGRILADARASRIEFIIAKTKFAIKRADEEAKG